MDPNQIPIALVLVFVQNWLRNQPWFPLITKDATAIQAKANHIFAIVAAGAATVGVHFTLNVTQHQLVIDWPTWQVFFIGVWHWITQYALTKGSYHLLAPSLPGSGPVANQKGSASVRATFFSAFLAALVLLALIFALRGHALPNLVRAATSAAACGTERWDVKTLSDAAADQVLVHSPAHTTVTQLRTLSSPSSVPSSFPRQEAEKRTYSVRAQLLGYKLESDRDFHLVIAEMGDSGRTMIAEIPSPECGTDPHWAEIRQDLVKQFGKPPAGHKMRWLSHPATIDITGVFFFDKPHGQTGVAPNAAELHPVLSLSVVEK